MIAWFYVSKHKKITPLKIKEATYRTGYENVVEC